VLPRHQEHETVGPRSGHPERALALQLDVTDRAAVQAVVAAAASYTGRLDVLVNNAGYGLAGGVEEVSEAQVRDQFEVNVFGALWCSQAVLPVMRAQGAGQLFQISSIGGVARPTPRRRRTSGV
jgi:NAD(P)-dependent dehydrogenase (short-subunit alcohol dehydrogenase family)